MSDSAGPPTPLRRDWTPSITGYRVAEEIGRGGFALVYRAEQLALRRTVAVKVVSGLDVDRSRLRRFERECAAIGSLSSHPHVVSVYDAGTTNEGLPFLSMEYLPEGSLADRLRAKGPLPYDDVIEIGIQLCGALEAAHHSDVLHRDIKPENILVDPRGRVKLADFGIAFVADSTSHTATGTMVGTVKHSAPEVLGGARATVTADVYSLGSTMFALLTGNAPFWRASDESAMPAMLRATRDPLPDLREHDVPDALAALIEQACAKNTSDRFPSAAAFGQALQSIQSQLGDDVTPMQTDETPLLVVPVASSIAPLASPSPSPSPTVEAPVDGSEPAVSDAPPMSDASPTPPAAAIAPAETPAEADPAVTQVTPDLNATLARPAPGTVSDDVPPPPDGPPPADQFGGLPRWALAAGAALVVALILAAVFFIRRGDDGQAGKGGPNPTSESTTASSDTATAPTTAPTTSASTTASTVPETTTSTTTSPPPAGNEQEIAEATQVAEANYPGYQVTDTSGWRGKQGVSSVVATDGQGREKVVVFIDGVHVGEDYPTSPSHNLTMGAIDANGFTVTYDLFAANQDDNCCAPTGQHTTRFDRNAAGRLTPSNKSAPYDQSVDGHR